MGKLKLYLAFFNYDLLKILKNEFPEVKEMIRLEKEKNEALYEHPLFKGNWGWVMIDIDSDISQDLLRYHKTGKLSKRLKTYIIEEIENSLSSEEEKGFTPQEKAKEGIVYVLKSKNVYKIGSTKDFNLRIKRYITENPFGVNIVLQGRVKNYREIEKKLQQKFGNKRVQGEWFKLSKEDIKYIKNYLKNEMVPTSI